MWTMWTKDPCFVTILLALLHTKIAASPLISINPKASILADISPTPWSQGKHQTARMRFNHRFLGFCRSSSWTGMQDDSQFHTNPTWVQQGQDFQDCCSK